MRKRGRPRVWLEESDFIRKHHLLFPKPPVCICGAHNYRYRKYKHSIEVYARCNQCDAMYAFNPHNQEWRRLYSERK